MKFPNPADRLFLALLEKLLEVDPVTRITAANALNDPYFTNSEVTEPAKLQPFNVEPVTEWMEQERQKKEYEERKQQQETREKVRLEEQQRQQAASQAAQLESKSAMRQNIRQTNAAVNKFTVIRPGAGGARPNVGAAGAPGQRATLSVEDQLAKKPRTEDK